MPIYWTDFDRNVSKSFFNPKLDTIAQTIYHNLHCDGHYNGKVTDGKLVLTCRECSHETTKIDSVIIKSITFARIVPKPVDSNES